MKRFYLLAVLCLSISLTFAQNIQFPPSIVAAGGNGQTSGNKQVSKWRIGHVNILQLNSETEKSVNTIEASFTPPLTFDYWKINAFPNPVSDYLHIQFDITIPTPFKILVSDVTGRQVIVRDFQLIAPNQIVKIDMKNLISALYIVNIQTSSNSTFKVLKVTKN